jgi:hypothetical protein
MILPMPVCVKLQFGLISCMMIRAEIDQFHWKLFLHLSGVTSQLGCNIIFRLANEIYPWERFCKMNIYLACTAFCTILRLFYTFLWKWYLPWLIHLLNSSLLKLFLSSSRRPSSPLNLPLPSALTAKASVLVSINWSPAQTEIKLIWVASAMSTNQSFLALYAIHFEENIWRM